MDTQSFDYFLVTNSNSYVTQLEQDDYIVVFDREDHATVTEVLHAANNTRAMIMDVDGLLNVSEERPDPLVTILDVAAQHVVDVDAMIEKYAGRLEQIYAKRTAGDYSMHGVLACFLMELEGK